MYEIKLEINEKDGRVLTAISVKKEKPTLMEMVLGIALETFVMNKFNEHGGITGSGLTKEEAAKDLKDQHLRSNLHIN